MSGVGNVATGRTRLALPCALLAGLALIWLVLARAQIVELCAGQLLEVAEPAHWRRLPEYARPNDKDGMRLGRFRVLARGPDPEHLDHEIYDPAFCKSRGVSLAAWFKREPKTTRRYGVDLHLRQDESGTFVVSGEEYPAMQPGEAEHFVVAFRRVVGANAAIVSPGRLLIGLTLVAGLVSSVFGWLHTHRLRRASTEAPYATVSAVALRRARWGVGIGFAALSLAAVLQLYTDREEARSANRD